MINPYPKVAVIILNWNGFSDTCDCVESVLKSDYPHYEIFLVDNGSGDDSAVKLKERFPQVSFIQNTENLGYTGGNNIAIKQALNKGFDYFWLLNNDTVIENTCITALIESAQQNESVGLLTPLIYDFSDKAKLQHAGCYVNWNPLSMKRINSLQEYLNAQDKHQVCLWGTALLIKKSVVVAIGFLDEKFFAYHEDWDYCLRAIKAGLMCKVVVNTRIYHKNNLDLESIKGRKDHYFYYLARNGLWFNLKHSRGLGKVSILQNYFSKIIGNAGFYKELKCYEAVDATFDGLYHAIFNISGVWDRNIKCPKFINRIVMAHPFLITDLINLRFDRILFNLIKKGKQE